ncbi:MAG TPA: glycosyltransferase family 39 protein, partial [Pyrinomonadaceae bacterium]|nr:glycosyltransferase family 39 protein [Pyrinomonadaceae bacterium]
MGKKRSQRKSKRNGKPNGILVYVLLLVAAFSFRASVARLYPNDTPDDGKLYAQMARNVLEQHSYSHETEPPFVPSLIRLPGYPLFLAGVYSLFGHNDNGAVRIVQALIDTATCGLIALVAFLWEPDEKRKRRTSIAALALAALCPFTTIYVATILTETLTMFFAVAMCLTATLALKATKQRNTLWLWLATGLLAGVAVLFRPDSGLFALAIGITLVVSTLGRSSEMKLSRKGEELLYRTARASYLGAVFSLAFCLVLVPWAIRNYRVFHLFQPLAPAHAEMPGEFVPRGYFSWLRTWIDDGRYIGPVLWSLDASPIKVGDLP